MILYSAVLLEALSDLNISGGAIGAFTYENKDVLIFFSPICIPFISFSCLICCGYEIRQCVCIQGDTVNKPLEMTAVIGVEGGSYCE